MVQTLKLMGMNDEGDYVLYFSVNSAGMITTPIAENNVFHLRKGDAVNISNNASASLILEFKRKNLAQLGFYIGLRLYATIMVYSGENVFVNNAVDTLPGNGEFVTENT